MTTIKYRDIVWISATLNILVVWLIMRFFPLYIVTTVCKVLVTGKLQLCNDDEHCFSHLLCPESSLKLVMILHPLILSYSL